MAFRILLVAATALEVNKIKEISGIRSSGKGLVYGKNEISLLVTGVGHMATSWSMARWLFSNPKPDLAINIGIAGSFRDEIRTGEVVMPVSDCFADAGIEDGEIFRTLPEAGLAGADDFPYKSGRIEADRSYSSLMNDLMRPVKAITLNTATGSMASRERLVRKFNPDIETMEGATFFYICACEVIPYMALRAISNRIEHRNKDNWNIPLALDALSEKFKEVILRLETKT